MIFAGPLYARLFRNVKSNPITLFVAPLRPESELPERVQLLRERAAAGGSSSPARWPCPTRRRTRSPTLKFWTNPLIVMLLALAVATWTLGLSRGMKMQQLMDDYGNSVKDIAVILLIIAGAGHAERGVRRHAASTRTSPRCSPASPSIR